MINRERTRDDSVITTDQEHDDVTGHVLQLVYLAGCFALGAAIGTVVSGSDASESEPKIAPGTPGPKIAPGT